MSEEYIKPGRVLIAVQMVFIPLYFFILSNSLESPVFTFVPDWFLEISIRLIIPTVLSIPFVLFSFYQRYEVSEAYEHMGETVSRLPNSIKVFYGFNFFLVLLFGLPVLAPLIAMSGGYFIGLLIFGKKEDTVQISRPVIRILTAIFIPFAIVIGFVFVNQVWDVFISLMDLWVHNLEFIYISSLNIANGALISGALLVIFEYIERESYTFEKPPYLSAILGILTFIILELFLIYFIYFTEEGLSGFQYVIFVAVNVAGFILSVIILVIRTFLRTDDEDEGTGLLGWITILIFQLVNILSSGSTAVFSRSIAIILTSIIFIILFIVSYNKALNYT